MKEYYGYEDQERLDSEPEEVIERLMDDKDYSYFPIKIHVFKPMEIAKDAQALSKDILEDLLERLDENLADPDGSGTEPSEAMELASLELAKVMMEEYTPWACERTGEVLEYSKEEAEKIVK